MRPTNAIYPMRPATTPSHEGMVACPRCKHQNIFTAADRVFDCHYCGSPTKVVEIQEPS